MAPTGRKAPKTTLLRTPKRGFFAHTALTRLKKSRRGFTLVEILVVLAIIAMVMTFGLPLMSRVTSQQISSTARRFSGVIRTIRNDAVLLNQIHRLVVDMEEQKWWVEAQTRFDYVNTMSEAIAAQEENTESAGSSFALAQKYGKEPKEMPGGVEIEGLFVESEGLFREGIAYIHFFPNGYVDSSVLFLKKAGGSDVGYALNVNPSTGKVEITDEPIANYQK